MSGGEILGIIFGILVAGGMVFIAYMTFFCEEYGAYVFCIIGCIFFLCLCGSLEVTLLTVFMFILLALCLSPIIVKIVQSVIEEYKANAEKRMAIIRAKEAVKKAEQERIANEKFIAEKTRQIKRENAHIDKQIKRYKELQKQTTCTEVTIKPYKKLTLLLSMLDSDSVKELTKLLSGYESIAKEKADIEKAVNNLAGLYRDIGNYTEENRLECILR